MSLRNKIYLTAILCILAWDSTLYAQRNVMRMERVVLFNSELNSSNPSLLQIVEDTILLNVKSYYSYGKGDFANYFSPKQYYKSGIETESYNRLNAKTVVYGSASYNYNKGKKSSGTSFLHPYRMPFNFIEKTENTKGDRQIEQYQLVGAISYKVSEKWIFGTKIDYKTVSFAKLKDMRNVNNILDLKLNIGLTYQLSDRNKLGFSYKYYRYIENIHTVKYGKMEIDHYALVDRGAFMGLFHLYGEEGLLKNNDRKPWVDISHNYGMQYTKQFANDSKWFVELNYEKGKGHFGNESDNEVVYMRHNRKKYIISTQLSLPKINKTQIITASGNYVKLINNEQLFQESRKDGGRTIITYYGERESFARECLGANIQYLILWGDNYLKAPWKLSVAYRYNNIKRKASYYPYYRKQNIKRSIFSLDVAKTIAYKKTTFTLKYGSDFVNGSGGDPKDGTYIPSSGSINPPDYLNTLLYKEKEYLTAKRLVSSATIRANYNYKLNMDIYWELNATYTKPFKLEYLNGNSTCITLTAGVAF